MREILEARKSTHGDFREQFACAQQIKTAFVKFSNGRTTAVQNESLDQIAHKISRILTGDPKHADHWRDIAGYATCIADDLEKDMEPSPKQPPLKTDDALLQELYRQAQQKAPPKEPVGWERRVPRYKMPERVCSSSP